MVWLCVFNYTREQPKSYVKTTGRRPPKPTVTSQTVLCKGHWKTVRTSRRTRTTDVLREDERLAVIQTQCQKSTRLAQAKRRRTGQVNGSNRVWVMGNLEYLQGSPRTAEVFREDDRPAAPTDDTRTADVFREDDRPAATTDERVQPTSSRRRQTGVHPTSMS
jgi:hypothetical protein